MQANSPTKDRFHAGRFIAFQPPPPAHRSGLDALLLAAALPQNAKGLLIDLGAGAGVAGLAALSANPKLEALLVDIDPGLVELAERSLALPENHHLAGRGRALAADVTLRGEARTAAGLPPATADWVIMNPPYNDATHRVSPSAQRARAHAAGQSGLEPWVRTAASVLKPKGGLVLICRAASLGEVLALCEGRFGGVEIVPIHSRAGEAARRIVITAKRGSRAPTTIAPSLVVHRADGTFTTRAQAIFDGAGRL